MNDTNLGIRLRSLRREAGYTQAKLARDLDISPSYLNLIEHGHRRLSAELLLRAAAVLKLDLGEIAADPAVALQRQVMEALSEPTLDDPDVKGVDLGELVARQPGVARAIVALHRNWRMAQDALDHLGSGGLESGAGGLDPSRLPSEEINDLVQRHNNYFPELEAAAESLWRRWRLSGERLFEGLARILDEAHGVRVQLESPLELPGVLRRYDPVERVLHLAETLPPCSRHFHMAWQIGALELMPTFDRVLEDPHLSADSSVRLGRMVLSSYFAGAMLMPYETFLTAAEELRYDVDLLGHRFRASFEQVCHRLTCLRREGREGVPFHLVKIDTAGNILKRFSASGIGFARFSAGCPLWNVNAAFMTPGRIRVQVSVMPDGERYFCVARTLQRRHGGWRSRETIHAIALGCSLEHASKLVYGAGIDPDRVEPVPIGTNCRVCTRAHCEQRAFPSMMASGGLDPNVRRVSFFAEGEG